LKTTRLQPHFPRLVRNDRSGAAHRLILLIPRLGGPSEFGLLKATFSALELGKSLKKRKTITEFSATTIKRVFSPNLRQDRIVVQLTP
jgi:hypothetical protein